MRESERELTSEWWEEQREKDRQTELSREPEVGLNPKTLRSRPEVKLRIRCLAN